MTVATLIFSGYVVMRDPAPSSSASTSSASPNASPAAEAGTQPFLPALDLPRRPKVQIIGDSWTYGYAATPTSRGYAFLASKTLGWDATISTIGSGTGYVNEGDDGAGTFKDQISRLRTDPDVDLLVIQGGLNDWRTADQNTYGRIVRATITTGRQKFPHAEILLMAPLWPGLGDGPRELKSVGDIVSAEAIGAHAYLVNPASEDWFDTDRSVRRYVDHAKLDHPNTAGHAYLASQLVDDVRLLMKRGQECTPFEYVSDCPGA